MTQDIEVIRTVHHENGAKSVQNRVCAAGAAG
jgi:hypothetical protein